MSHSYGSRVTAGELTQLVAFRTDLPVDRFIPTWRPVAAGFLARGLDVITLAAFDEAGQDDGAGIRLLSRNTWPAADYHRAFSGGSAADGAAGPVAVRQAGVFAVHPGGGTPVAAARPDRDLSVALLQLADPDHVDPAVEAVLAAVPADPSRDLVVYRQAHPAQRYQVAVTVHGPAGTGADSTAALRFAARACPVGVGHGAFLTGRELLSLAS